MTNTRHTRPHTSTPTAPGLREASMHDLFMDSMRFGPAPTPGREAFATLVSFAILALALFVLDVNALGFVVAGALLTVFFAVRWALGFRKWGHR